MSGAWQSLGIKEAGGLQGRCQGRTTFIPGFCKKPAEWGPAVGRASQRRGGKEHHVNFAFVPAQKGHWVHSMPSLPAAKLDKLLHQREYEAVDY